MTGCRLRATGYGRNSPSQFVRIIRGFPLLDLLLPWPVACSPSPLTASEMP
jgi:hypothetical protein